MHQHSMAGRKDTRGERFENQWLPIRPRISNLSNVFETLRNFHSHRLMSGKIIFIFQKSSAVSWQSSYIFYRIFSISLLEQWLSLLDMFFLLFIYNHYFSSLAWLEPIRLKPCKILLMTNFWLLHLLLISMVILESFTQFQIDRHSYLIVSIFALWF